MPESERDNLDREEDRYSRSLGLAVVVVVVVPVEVRLPSTAVASVVDEIPSLDDLDLDRDTPREDVAALAGSRVLPSDDEERLMRRFPASSALFNIPSKFATRSSRLVATPLLLPLELL